MENIMSAALIEEDGLQSLEELNQYQVIRSEFVSPRLRAKVTFNVDSLTFSSKCVRLFPETQYIQLLINADEKLEEVFGGTTQVSMFEMTKLINLHLAKI